MAKDPSFFACFYQRVLQEKIPNTDWALSILCFHTYKITDNNLLWRLSTLYIKFVISCVTGKSIHPEADNQHAKFQPKWLKFNEDSTKMMNKTKTRSRILPVPSLPIFFLRSCSTITLLHFLFQPDYQQEGRIPLNSEMNIGTIPWKFIQVLVHLCLIILDSNRWILLGVPFRLERHSIPLWFLSVTRLPLNRLH